MKDAKKKKKKKKKRNSNRPRPGRTRDDTYPWARFTASSAPMARANPLPCASCSVWSAPTPAAVRLLGGDPWADAVDLHRHIAYVPGDVTLWPTLTGGETIDLLARMRGGIDAGRRAELIERFDLDPHKKARAYSKGNRQKVSLVSAFSSNARLLLLDEPSSRPDYHVDGERLPAMCQRGAAARGDRPAVQSHPGRNRGPV